MISDRITQDNYMGIFHFQTNAIAQTPPDSGTKIMDKQQDPEAAETVQTTSVPAVDLPRLVRLCRFCAQKIGLWMEWKSNHCLYDHATSMPCQECDGENLRKPESIFTVRLRLPNAKTQAPT